MKLPGVVASILCLCNPVLQSSAMAEMESHNFSPFPGFQTSVTTQDDKVLAITNGNAQVLVENISVIPEYAQETWVEDYNFDNHKEIAVSTSIDKVGEDELYHIFRWNPLANRFDRMNFYSKLSNLEIIEARQEIRSSYLSDKYWTEDTYRFLNGKPYLYSRSDLIAIDIWHTRVFDPSARVIRSLVSEDGLVEKPPVPVISRIKVPVANLYQAPLPSTISDRVFTEDEIVTILDFSISMNDTLSWVLIRTEIGNKSVQGWTLLENLDLDY
ncbi:MAG: Unknown protein [uncultured Thiotrichaceae bacterium]|uniref:SH3b domain-containing protein n=1 Tax=uncultured Thiotrichaceae bacterium TaxID=298394 RepID=A0A6S6SS09_9GAMM|nr:MAG: Unknown protein [uncultured Thiotrichaceae bacterium]